LTAQANRNQKAQRVYLQTFREICDGTYHVKCLASGFDGNKVRAFSVVAYHIMDRLPKQLGKTDGEKRTQIFDQVMRELQSEIDDEVHHDGMDVMNMVGMADAIENNRQRIIEFSAIFSILLARAKRNLIEAGFPQFERSRHKKLFRGLCMFEFPMHPPNLFAMELIEQCLNLKAV